MVIFLPGVRVLLHRRTEPAQRSEEAGF